MNRSEPPVEMQDNDQGSTTLKQCGWCEYASGTHRYNYCIKGNCSLDKSYSNEIMWNDRCKFIDASKSDIDAVIKNHLYTIKQNNESNERHEEYINKLTSIQNDAVYRPPLPDNRKHDHFNLNDNVMIHYENHWYTGEVRGGYRHHDGCVSYRLNGIGPQNEGFWGHGSATPTVLLEDEYQWFKLNPQEYLKWCEVAYDKEFNGEKITIAEIN